MKTRGGLAKAGVLETGNLRLVLSCLGAVCTACLVGGLEVNHNLDGGSGSGAGGPANNTSGSAGKASLGDGGQGVGDGGASASSAGSGTNPGAAGDDALPVGGDGPLGGAGAPSVNNCTGYAEQNDASNSAAPPQQTDSPETTGQTLSGGVEVCGQIDVGLQDASGIVDIDSYRFDVAQAGEAFFSLELPAAVAADSVELVVSSNGAGFERVRTEDQDARWWAKLAAGYATVSVVVRNPTALTKPVKYLLRAQVDDANLRCPAVTAALADDTVSEAGDGAGNTGNDVIRPSTALETQTLTAAADAVETPQLAISSGERGLISGTLANVDHGAGDAYRDGDMYDVRTTVADQLTFRLDWGQTTADLDLWVFLSDDLRSLAHSYSSSKTSPEFLTISAKNITHYWVWVGAATQSTGLPQDYSLTVCGEAN